MDKIYIIEHMKGSKVPFRITNVSDEDEALGRVFEHMGSNQYRIVRIEG